ncbi:hypothetical protein HJFPF1_11432 [Paramyrothecium foliicola]|nr:hypothetical protein HJFPF1_11432 [Paramyrothecium foliicola]
MTQSALVRLPAEIQEKILSQLIQYNNATSILISRSTDNWGAARPRFRGFACDGGVLDQLVEVQREYVDFDHDNLTDEAQRFRRDGYFSLFAVARTCRALHAEAIRLLYSKPVLQFVRLEDMHDFLVGIPSHCAPLVRNLKISLPLYPPVPQHFTPELVDIDPRIAMQYMRTILPLAPGLKRLVVASHVIDHSWSDDDDAGDEVESLIQEHWEVVALAKDAIRDEDGRDIRLDHGIIPSAHVDVMEED